ncbi:MAG: acyl-CoA thioesterase [Bacteroidetes bacterium]|jgi:acyl-CoA thioester hydrolase|nr:acyl-CoA thioesterase [Bacteroidota bacterium]
MELEELKKQFRFKMKLDIRWSDMDEMRHVNNAVYLTYFEQARVYYFHEACQWNWKEIGAILANAHVDYLRPVVFPNDTYVYVRTSKLGNKSFEVSYIITSIVKGEEQLTTTGSTTMVLFDYQTNKSVPMPDYLRERLSNYEGNKI